MTTIRKNKVMHADSCEMFVYRIKIPLNRSDKEISLISIRVASLENYKLE